METLIISINLSLAVALIVALCHIESRIADVAKELNKLNEQLQNWR